MNQSSSKRVLNQYEKKLAHEFPKEAHKTLRLALKASFEEEARYTEAGIDDNNANAFLHIYWSALLVKYISKEWAEKWTNAHEMEHEPNSLSKKMDLLNNGVGIHFAKENSALSDEELAIQINQLVSSGSAFIIKDKLIVKSDKKGIKEKNIFNAICNKIFSIIIELISSNQLLKKNSDGMSPLMLACATNYIEAVKVLVRKSNLDEKDVNGNTPLLIASSSQSEVLKELLDAGANVNEQNFYDKETALMKAASRGMIENVEILLKSGAKKDLKNFLGLTAYDIAVSENKNQLLPLLKINES